MFYRRVFSGLILHSNWSDSNNDLVRIRDAAEVKFLPPAGARVFKLAAGVSAGV